MNRASCDRREKPGESRGLETRSADRARRATAPAEVRARYRRAKRGWRDPAVDGYPPRLEGPMLLRNLAVLATALFSGAATYVSLVEHPARLRCSTEIALAQWRPSYQRGTVMQASLAIAGTLFGISAFLNGAGGIWLVSAILLGSVVPFTLVVIFPTNKRLEDPALNP